MIRVAGIDVSSKSIDVVTLPLDDEVEGGGIQWTPIPLEGDKAIARATLAIEQLPRGMFWDDVCHVAIERPYGNAVHSVMVAHLVIGAIIATLPDRLRPPRLIAPRSWRKQAGMAHDASKDDVRQHVVGCYPGLRRDLPQDFYDALSIARAARALHLVERNVRAQLRLEGKAART